MISKFNGRFSTTHNFGKSSKMNKYEKSDYLYSRLLPHHNNVRTTTVVVVVVHTHHSILKNDRTRTVSAHLNVLFK